MTDDKRTWPHPVDMLDCPTDKAHRDIGVGRLAKTLRTQKERAVTDRKDEPQGMTLEEAQRRYDAASAELDRICQGPRDKFRMRIPAQRDDSDLILSDALMALREMTAAVAAERDDRAELIAQLAECYRLSGADPDGNEDWRLAPRAVAEVQQLREEHDALQNREAELVKALQMCADELAVFIEAQYEGTLEHPVQKRRYERDMRSVFQARAALAAVGEEP